MLGDAGEQAKKEQDKEAYDFRVNMPGLPIKAYPKRIKDLARKFADKGMDVPLGVTAGAAIPMVAVALMVKWGFAPSFLILAWHASKCSDDGYAFYEWWVWAALLPTELAIMGIEYQCHRLVCVPQYQVLKCHKVLGVKVPYYVWAFASGLLSALHSLDVASDGAFVGTYLKGTSCAVHNQMQQMWELLLQESMFGGVASFAPSLTFLVIGSWAVTYLQLLYTMMETVPLACDDSGCCLCSCPEVDYEMATENREDNYRTEYHTVLCRSLVQNHGAALISLAEACGMHSVASEDMIYADCKAQEQFRNRNSAKELHYIHHVLSHIRRGVLRTFLVGALSNGWQLNLQVTFFMIRLRLRAKSGVRDSSDWQVFLSLALSGLALFGRIVDGYKRVTLAYAWISKFRLAISELQHQAHKDKAEKSLRSFMAYVFSLGVMTFICAAWCLYALLKLVMSMYVCEHALWNITGCVDAHVK